MVEEAFSNFGLFIDDENKIRLIDPERVTDSAELRDECKDFTDNVLEFKKIVDTLIEKTEEYSKQVEAARLKMCTLISFIFVLFTTTVYCQSVTVQFQTFSVNTDIGTCTCDLTANKCDVSCCCDPECTLDDKQAFSCSSRGNQYTNTTPIISTVQPSCYKNISIFQSNSPYIIQKMGELVCVDFQRYSGGQYYQQPKVQTLDPGSFVRTINKENSVTAPSGLPTNLTYYELTIQIVYSNPTGILNISATPEIVNAANDTTFEQTFTVQFIQSDSSSSSSSSTIRNPGYLQGANIMAGIKNESQVLTVSSSQFSIIQPLSTGECDLSNTQRIPIRFGENVRSTCKYK
ncbi:unnamed protein product [Rotaria sp. Silwood2]|nr:unnamed protein product [Rotaria sp. Silwood2]